MYLNSEDIKNRVRVTEVFVAVNFLHKNTPTTFTFADIGELCFSFIKIMFIFECM